MKAIIELKEFTRVIKVLKPFTREDIYDTSKKMPYIMADFSKEKQEVRFEALDGHRIAVEHLKCNVDESFIGYIKPFTPWKSESKYTEVELIGEVLTVDMGHYTLKTIQPQGEWYNTKKMIATLESTNPITKVCVNPKFIMDAVKGINQYDCMGRVLIETRNKKDAVIIREVKDKRNIRFILPMNFTDYIEPTPTIPLTEISSQCQGVCKECQIKKDCEVAKNDR